MVGGVEGGRGLEEGLVGGEKVEGLRVNVL